VVGLLQSAARSRVGMLVVVSLLALDLGSTGICCIDDPVPSSGSVASSSAPAPSSDSTPHVDDNCFCCARSVATSLMVWDPLEGLACEIRPPRRALQLHDFPPPYHPPQSRA
jgi:hypothetical protein